MQSQVIDDVKEPISTQILDGSDLDQNRVEWREEEVYVDNILIKQSDTQQLGFDESLTLLIRPETGYCNDSIYVSNQGELYQLILGAMFSNSWFIDEDDPAKLSAEGFAQIEGCYFRNKDHIIYQGKALEKADPESFSIIDPERDLAIDKNQVYLYQKPIPGDPGSYQAISRHYFKDKNFVYHLPNQDVKPLIEGASPTHFVALDDHYSKDNDQAWYHSYDRDEYSGEIEGADVDSFELIEEWFGKSSKLAKDKDYIYYKGNIVADAKGFEALPFGEQRARYFKDKSGVFYIDSYELKIFNELNPSTFEVLSEIYASDGNIVLYRGGVLNGADGKTFEVLSSYLGKDAKAVYRSDKVVTGIDPDTARYVESEIDNMGFPLGPLGVLVDQNQVYISGEPIGIDGVNTASLEVLSGYKMKDNKHVYCKPDENHEWMIMHEADPAIFEDDYAPGYSRSGEHIYLYCFKDTLGMLKNHLESPF